MGNHRKLPMARQVPEDRRTQLLPAGFRTHAVRSTDATVYVPIEGRGRTRIGQDFTVAWAPRNVFVAPRWAAVSHEAEAETVLFSFSDRPVQEVLGLYREDRGDA